MAAKQLDKVHFQAPLAWWPRAARAAKGSGQSRSSLEGRRNLIQARQSGENVINELVKPLLNQYSPSRAARLACSHLCSVPPGRAQRKPLDYAGLTS